MRTSLAGLCVSIAWLATGSPGQTRVLTRDGMFTTGRFGGVVAAAGDVDGDGYADWIASAINASASTILSGWSAVYSGRTGAVIHELPGHAPAQHFGGGAAGLGDLDGDGYADFAIGALNDSTAGVHAGRVWVFSGLTGHTIYDIPAEGPGDIFGHSIAAAGDVDADGVPDFIIGAPENGDPIPNYGAGYAKVFSGRTGAVLHRFPGRALTFEQGHAVAGVGDIDGDGHADVVVTAVLDGEPSIGIGAARVHSGRTGQVLFTFRGGAVTDHFGVSAAGVGDVDGDGVPDIGVGCLEFATLRPGHVSIFSGRTGVLLHRVVAAAASQMFSMSLCGVGDLDRDGYADFAVGAPMDNSGRGAVFVFRGRDGSLLRTIPGPSAGARFGMAMVATDINRDGYADLIVGANGWAQDLGQVQVVSGVNVTPMGSGCADYAPAPRLSASTPRIADVWTHFVHGAAPDTAALLLVSLVPPTPLRLGNRGCVAYVAPTSTLVLGAAPTDGSGTALYRFVLPADPRLVGLALATQVVMPARTLPFTLTNGIAVTIEP